MSELWGPRQHLEFVLSPLAALSGSAGLLAQDIECSCGTGVA